MILDTLTRKIVIFVIIILSVVFSIIVAAEKSLYWKSLDVKAKLDSEGRLQVTETHTMVFNGYWNGGERSFRVGADQYLDFISLKKYDNKLDRYIELKSGDLDNVDEYQWPKWEVLRWRSRLPTDPPFDETEITYQLNYVMSYILTFDNGEYILDHDFAFPERQWPIRSFQLTLEFDPLWSPKTTFSGTLTRDSLYIGESVVLRLPLAYLGNASPTSVRLPLPKVTRWTISAITLVTIISLVIGFIRHERSRGRYIPLIPVAEIDEAWLQNNVFALLPEVVGAAWDETTGAPEVAAVLARLVLEKKIKSDVKMSGILFFRKPVLHLELLVDRNDLAGYEKSLINKMFVSSNKTDTKTIRNYYRSRRKAFDPASVIEKPLSVKINKAVKKYRILRKGIWKKTLIIAGLAVVFLLVAAFYKHEFVLAFVMFISALLLGILPFIAAINYKKAYGFMFWNTIRYFFLAIVYIAILVGVVISGEILMSIWMALGIAIVALGFSFLFLEIQKTQFPTERFLLRRNLASARKFFIEELKSQNPRLLDEWYPYLLAFGLGRNIDKWFGKFSNRISDDHNDGATGGFSFGSSGSSGSSTWTGGGGSFGGAGASASWSVAAGSIAAGVAPPSSSSGGGSSGGGGGSSGGGGGGGW